MIHCSEKKQNSNLNYVTRRRFDGMIFGVCVNQLATSMTFLTKTYFISLPLVNYTVLMRLHEYLWYILTKCYIFLSCYERYSYVNSKSIFGRS